mgnify:CR=1 FL=1
MVLPHPLRLCDTTDEEPYPTCPSLLPKVMQNEMYTHNPKFKIANYEMSGNRAQPIK